MRVLYDVFNYEIDIATIKWLIPNSNIVLNVLFHEKITTHFNLVTDKVD